MSGKRQRVAVELPAVGQAALPAVCYVPSILAEGADLTGNPTAPVDGALHSLAKRLKYSVHAKARLGHTIQLVHASLGDIEYVGRSDGDENSGVQPCCYALGVYRPVEGKLQLVSVAGDRLFRLDTRCGAMQRSEDILTCPCPAPTEACTIGRCRRRTWP